MSEETKVQETPEAEVKTKKPQGYVKPTDEQVESWKKKYPEGVFEIEVEDKTCFLHYPDLRTYQFAIKEMKRAGAGAFNAAIINNSWLHGDPVIREDDSYYFGLCESLDEVVQIPDYEMKRVNHPEYGACFEFSTCGMKCYLRKPQRAEVEASSKNEKNPLDGTIKVMNKVWLGGDKKIKSRTDCFASLLSAYGELLEAKASSIKKR